MRVDGSAARYVHVIRDDEIDDDDDDSGEQEGDYGMDGDAETAGRTRVRRQIYLQSPRLVAAGLVV